MGLGTPTLHVDDDQTDRIGIRTLTYSLLWFPSRWPMSVPDMDAEMPGVPDVGAAMEFFGHQTRSVPGGLRTSWTFRGILGDGKDVTFKDRAHSFDWRFEPGFAQVDLLLLPGIQAIIDKYGGTIVDGQLTFPPTLANTPGSGSGTKVSSSGDNAPSNPMFGQTDWFRLEGTYTHHYASLSLPSQSGVGEIHDSGALPGQAPVYDDGRNWLKLPVQYKGMGVVIDCTETYWLSGPGGWPKPVYGGGGGNSSSDGGSS